MAHTIALFISGQSYLLNMVSVQETTVQRIILARLSPGEDILDSLENLVLEEKIEGAQISFIGAISCAHLGYFDLESMTYKSFTLDDDLEVTSGLGNVSRLEDGTPVVHAHIVVADESGKSHSGHLMKGCKVSVTIEIVLLEFANKVLRKRDERTGLNLLSLH